MKTNEPKHEEVDNGHARVRVLLKECDQIVSKISGMNYENEFQISHSMVFKNAFESILKIILLKRDWSKYSKTIITFSYEELVNETMSVLGLEDEKKSIFAFFAQRLNTFYSQSYTVELSANEFNDLTRDFLFFVSILCASESLLTNNDSYPKLIRKIESLGKNDVLESTFRTEWTKSVHSELVRKKLSITYPLTIYLDQKDWVVLLQVWKKKVHNEKINRLLRKLLRLAYADKIRVPLSLNHMLETNNRADKQSRDELIELMISLSRGFTIAPYTKVMPYEIENAIYRRLNLLQKVIPVEKLVFSRGIGNILGARPTVVPKPGESPDVDTDAIEAVLYTPEALRLGFSIRNTQIIKDRMDEDAKLVTKIEENKEYFESKFKDKDLRRRARIVYPARESVIPKIVEITLREGYKKEDVAKVIGTNKEELTAFFEEMPTSFCSFTLTRKRDEQTSTNAQEHDLYDIASLSIAIPYCDIIVCEKKFGSFAVQEKLDKKYDVLILRNLEELDDYLW